MSVAKIKVLHEIGKFAFGERQFHRVFLGNWEYHGGQIDINGGGSLSGITGNNFSFNLAILQ